MGINQQTFLLVEDDKICQYLTSNFLKELGGDVDIAGTAQKALDLLGGKQYALIFLDIGLPDRNGIELMQIMQKKFHVNVPVVATTGHARHAQKNAYMDAGMSAVLEKPVSKEALAKVIQQLLH